MAEASSCVRPWPIFGCVRWYKRRAFRANSRGSSGAVSTAGLVTSAIPPGLDHNGCQRVCLYPPALSSQPVFFCYQALSRRWHHLTVVWITLLWPGHGQVLGLTPPLALAAVLVITVVLPVGAPLVHGQDISAVQRTGDIQGCSPAAMVCHLYLGVTGKPWREEQGRKGAQPLQYRGFSLVSRHVLSKMF